MEMNNMNRQEWIEAHKQMSKDELLVLAYRLSIQHEEWRNITQEE